MKIERIFDILENLKNDFPDKRDILVAKVSGNWHPVSVKEYYETAYKLSYGLMALGLKKGDRVATISNNRPEWNFMDMALLQAGFVHVPIYPTISADDYTYILNHCEPRLVIVSDKSLFERIEPIAKKVKSVAEIYSYNELDGVKHWSKIRDLGADSEKKFNGVLKKIREEIQPDDLATLIYTSGTTGNPKGVMLTHRNILSNVEGISQIFNFGVNDRTLSFLPISHVFERTINYYFQRMAVSVYYAENLGTISENLKEVKPTIFIAVPRVLERIYDRIMAVGKELKGIKKSLFFWAVNLGLKFEFNRANGWWYHAKLSVADRLIFAKWRLAVGNACKLIVAGGAALQPRLIRIFNAAGIPLVEGYGMTETSPVIAANRYDAGEVMIGTVGPILPGVSVRIAEDGEILVKGETIMKGYYHNEEQSREMFDSEGWLKTGDVGTFVNEKYLKITDRKKEIFKLSSGKYIAPQVIENKFKESLLVEQVMVIGENEKFASALISPNMQHLQKWCSRHRLRFENADQMLADPKVLSLFQKEVRQLNKKLGQTEHIKRFRLVKDEWTPMSGELSPTLKLKRRFLIEKYSDLLADIYSAGRSGKFDAE